MRSAVAYILLACCCVSCKLFKRTGPSGPVDAVFATDTSSNRQTYYAGEAAYLQGNLDEARKIFERFVITSPEPAAGYYRLSEIALKKEDREAAAGFNRKAREKDPQNEYYQLQQAELLELDKKFGEAGEIYLLRTYKNPKFWSLYQDAIKNFNRDKDAERMLATCRLWEKQFGLREEIAYNYSAAYQRLGHEDSALQIQKRLIEKYPERWKYKEKLWQYYLAKGHEKEALALYEEIISQDPDNTGIPVIMCDHLQSTAMHSPGHWKAIYALAANSRLEFKAKQTCVVSALDHTAAGMDDSLYKMLDILDRRHMNDEMYLQASASFYRSKGNFTQAITRYDKLRKKAPNLFLAWVNTLTLLDTMKQYPRLAAVADSMTEVFPSMVHPYYYLAAARMHLKEYQSSMDAANSGMIYALESAWKHRLKLILANDLNYLSRYDESLKQVNAVLAEDKDNPEALALKAELDKKIKIK